MYFYYTAVFSIISYCILVFNKLLENEMKQFCNVTKDITRNFVIKYAYFYSTSKTLASIENTRNEIV